MGTVINIMSKKTFQLRCELCSYVTKWGILRNVKLNLTNHIINQHKEKEHKCDNCNKKFSFLYQKRRHTCKDVDSEQNYNEENAVNKKKSCILQEERAEDKHENKIDFVIKIEIL